MRVLVTGSRDWPYEEVVWQELWSLGGDLVIVEGGCPTGADAFARDYARSLEQPRVVLESHPADWDKHGKAAGPIRNQEMVDLGANLCVAFRFNSSRGTTDCIRRATAACIPCHVIDLHIDFPKVVSGNRTS